MTISIGPPAVVRPGPLHPKRLARTSAAFAALTGSLSVLSGIIAARFAPHGLRGIAVSLHLARQPTLVKVAAAMTSVALVCAGISGLLHFYTWWREHELD